MAGLALKKLQRESPGLEIETVEAATNPLRTWRDGIRMIPALRGGGEVLSGLILSPGMIRSFVEKVGTDR